MQQENRSAERYVKKVGVNPEMSHNKLLARIREGSKVLEFGPASGAMTRELCRNMGCEVSIVEIDAGCYEKVMQYAKAGVCADIEEFDWLEKFEGEYFDYILFADVLEHLKNPEKVLNTVKQFLKQDGSILISVPNIAHNSIIIQLLKNEFVYQSTGILDYTHLRHFTFSELQKMCVEAGYSAVYMDAVYIGVGKNEFDVSYADIEPQLADALKKRPFGEVYQHILEIKKREYVEGTNISVKNCLGEPKCYTNLWLKEAYKDSFILEDKVMELLCKNPNFFMGTNEEVARLRLEINEMYLAESALADAVALQKRVNEYQYEVREKNRHIRVLVEQEEQMDRHLENAKAKLSECMREIEEKNMHIKDMEAKLSECMRETEEKNMHIKDMEAKLSECIRKTEEKNMCIEDMKAELSQYIEIVKQKDEQIMSLEQDKQSTNSELESIRAERDALVNQISELQQTIRNKEGHIELLLDVEREYEREKKSRTYKMALLFRKISVAILPVNSKRRFFAKILGKAIRHPLLMMKMINPRRIKNCFTILKTEGVDSALHHLDLVEKFEQSTDIDAGSLQVAKVNGENKTLADYGKLTFTKHKNPLVSIIIPVYNQFDYTYHCLESILKNSGEIPYEIIIGNDCSTDLTTEIDKVVEGITVINNKNNLRFLLNCNNAAKYAKGEFILFLNNDTQVQANWLQPLVDLMDQDEKIGMVGSKLVYSDGYLQEAGGIFWKDASAWNYGNRQNPEDPEYNYVKDADYISGASIMIRHTLWKEIGGFDERFVPAYYEDADLAFEVRKHGYRVVYQPLSVVVHFEGVSNGTDLSSGQKAYQVTNQQKFYDKWKDVLEKEHYPNAENVFLAKDRSGAKKHILVIDHYVPHYDKDAGSKGTFMYLKLFVKMGYKVTFIGDNFFKHEPYTTALNQCGIEVLYGAYYYNNWEEWLKNNLHYFDYVYLQRPHISVKYMDLVKQYGRAKIFYYAVDLHYLREYREYLLTGDEEKKISSEKWKEIEYDLFSKADVGHVVGSYEQGIVQKDFPDKPIRNIPLYTYENLPDDINLDFSQRKDILFVGGFGHAPNIDAVKWFAKEVLPIVLAKKPEIKWHVVGSKVPQEIAELANENILIEGFLPDEELEVLYRECKLAVVPLRVGAGVKGKVLESAFYQIPLVTTSIGAEGLDDSVGNMLVVDDANEMAERILSLYDDTECLKQMSQKGRTFIESYFTEDEAMRILELDL